MRADFLVMFPICPFGVYFQQFSGYNKIRREFIMYNTGIRREKQKMQKIYYFGLANCEELQIV